MGFVASKNGTLVRLSHSITRQKQTNERTEREIETHNLKVINNRTDESKQSIEKAKEERKMEESKKVLKKQNNHV